MNADPLRVLIVDDSSVVRQLLRHILERQGMFVTAEAADGLQALDKIARERPDVITMDIHMPVMDGYECSRRIMERDPIPIVVVTASYKQQDAAIAMKVLEAGAITVLRKPQGIDHPDFERDAQALVKTVRAVSEVKLVRRIPRSQLSQPQSLPIPDVTPGQFDLAVLAIGASTGGPVAIKSLLEKIAPDFPCPVLIVQHIAPGFLPSFCTWLGETSALPVSIGEYAETVLPGRVYLAPDRCHMEIDGAGRIVLVNGSDDEILRPSVARLFDSVGRHYGRRAVAILLTGMGRDGAREMAELKAMGALTLAQDPATVVVNGMPGEAVKLGAACHVLNPEQMAVMLNRIHKGVRR